MSILLRSILLGLIGVWSTLDYGLGSLYTFRPICLGALTGLVMGDLATGIKMGAVIELIFIGSVSIGAYIPPDATVAGILGTAFAIASGEGVEAAMTLAMPLALASLAIGQLYGPLITAALLPIADKYAAEGNIKGVRRVHFTFGGTGMLISFLKIFLAYYFGSELVTSLIALIPDTVFSGLSVGSGILPTLGFAMLMRSMMTKKMVPYYFLGFTLVAFFNAPILGVAIFGIVFVIDKFDLLSANKNKKVAVAAANGGNLNEEEF